MPRTHLHRDPRGGPVSQKKRRNEQSNVATPSQTSPTSAGSHWRGPALAVLGLALSISLAYGWFRHRPETGGTAPPSEASNPSLETSDAPPPLNASKPPSEAPDGMVWIPGGKFWMGCEDPTMVDARPIHLVTVDGFWMDRTEVTNAQFARFVEATGYVTVAERKPDPNDFPGAPPEALVPGSLVFTPPPVDVPLDNHLIWWSYVPGASWRHPSGPNSDIQGKDNHPVVQVCWEDAVAYAKWAGKRLPTEAEWEFAARGGLDRKRYVWGDDMSPGGKWMVNNWQGQFPAENTEADGYRTTAPVGSFPPNGYGLFDMAGNVWEWCSDWYRPDYYNESPSRNPKGPDTSYDPLEVGVPKRVQRGGSFLCSDLYCTRYIPGSRGKGEPSSAASHIGFRCVMDPKPSR